MKKESFKVDLIRFGYPIAMLTRNTRSWLGSKIADVTKGFYNHFCWLVNYDEVASQDWIFHKVPIDEYLTSEYVVKFVVDTRWGFGSRQLLRGAISEDLHKPFIKRLYDPLAILGQWTGLKWINNPMTEICSDKGKYLKLTDPKYDLKHPSPTDINEYMKANQASPENHGLGYKVVSRWMPEDV